MASSEGASVGEVLLDRPPGEEAVVLKKDGGLAGWEVLHRPPPELLQAGQHPEKGGFAAA